MRIERKKEEMEKTIKTILKNLSFLGLSCVKRGPFF